MPLLLPSPLPLSLSRLLPLLLPLRFLCTLHCAERMQPYPFARAHPHWTWRPRTWRPLRLTRPSRRTRTVAPMPATELVRTLQVAIHVITCKAPAAAERHERYYIVTCCSTSHIELACTLLCNTWPACFPGKITACLTTATLNSQTPARRPTCLHVCTPIRLHAYTPAHLQAYTPTRLHTCAPAHLHIYTNPAPGASEAPRAPAF